ESDLVDDVQKGQEDAEEIVEELYALDEEQVKAMESVKENLNDMRNFISDLETLFKDGDLSVSNYDVTAVLGLESFHSVSEGVYGEGGIIGFILNKYQNGEAITATESDTLYKYFQTIVLDDKTKKELEEVAGFINETDIDKLTEHLNEKVVVSDDALEEEMMMVQAYIFFGTNQPSDTGVEYYMRRKLEAYLMLLKNYHTHMMVKSNVMLIKDIKYEEDRNDITGYFLDSEIALNKYNPDDGIHEIHDLKSKDDYRKWVFFNSEFPIVPEYVQTQVMYATGRSAASNIDDSELNKLKEENANYEANFVATTVLKKVISGLAKKFDISDWVDAASIVTGYNAEKKESEDKIEIEEALSAAGRLDLEVSISELTSDGELNIQLYPLDATFEKIERWKEVHREKNIIPFPEEDINKHDWYEIGKTLKNIERKYGTKITDYIQDNTLNGVESAEELVRELE
ncbi:MAG TPA: T7SS effector LXG polymorphic toxin, partial [Candidatus Avamphibacillus sp.]|nr:T7SS effector LXG polymorphic toxin [Candidatus Avamphibacillus sp.]